jgi:hypothetical protein
MYKAGSVSSVSPRYFTLPTTPTISIQVSPVLQALPERLVVRQDAANEAFADDRRRPRFLTIVTGEVPTLQSGMPSVRKKSGHTVAREITGFFSPGDGVRPSTCKVSLPPWRSGGKVSETAASPTPGARRARRSTTGIEFTRRASHLVAMRGYECYAKRQSGNSAAYERPV